MKRRFLGNFERKVYAVRHIPPPVNTKETYKILKLCWKQGIEFVEMKKMTNPVTSLELAAGSGCSSAILHAGARCRLLESTIYFYGCVGGLAIAVRQGHVNTARKIWEICIGDRFIVPIINRAILQSAIRSGSIPMMRTVFEFFGTERMYKRRGQFGELDVYALMAESSRAAAKPKCLRMMVYLKTLYKREFTHHSSPYGAAMRAAASNGNTRAMRLLYSWGYSKSSHAPALFAMSDLSTDKSIRSLKLAVRTFFSNRNDREKAADNIHLVLSVALSKGRVRCARWLAKFIQKENLYPSILERRTF